MRLLRSILVLALTVGATAHAQVVNSPGGGSSSGALVVATTGPLSLTGTTAETVIATLKVPAGSMGPNGMVRLECLWNYTNSSNNKTLSVRHSATSGILTGPLVVAASVMTTSASAQTLYVIRNNNAANLQTMFPAIATAPYGTSAAAVGAGSNNTANDTYLNINGTLALGTETITVQHCAAVISYAP